MAERPSPVRGIRAVGDRALLVELDSLAAVLNLQAHLVAHPQRGQVDVIAAAETVVVTTDSSTALSGLATYVLSLDLSSRTETTGDLVTIDTVYDGEDLADVGELTGLSTDGILRAHTGQVWTAAFAGFAPGFAYLVGENDTLSVPRRTSPRTAVPAGAVALGGSYSAVYPRQSPGGWQLIGRTAARMWDLDRPTPALLRSGDRVRFRPVRATARMSDSRGTQGSAASTIPAPRPGLVIVRPGPQSTVQDQGRPGYAALGVPVAGAMDRGALRRANHLVGNEGTAAGIEVLYGGLVLSAQTDQVLAVTGAPLPLDIVPADAAETGRQREVPMDSPFALLAGETLSFGAPESGLRSYLAVRGGLDLRQVLGSRSTDTMSGIGPEPLERGSGLVVLPAPLGSAVGVPDPQPPASADGVVLHVVPGPRQDWFSPDIWQSFLAQEWTVTQHSNRIGLRLDGRSLTRSRDGELASEGTVRGAVQIPPEGQPVLFLSDHPVTGGYPVLCVVVDADLDRAGQLPPGSSVRFAAANDGANPLCEGLQNA